MYLSQNSGSISFRICTPLPPLATKVGAFREVVKDHSRTMSLKYRNTHGGHSKKGPFIKRYLKNGCVDREVEKQL